ncbi:diaminopimelate epimerase [Paracoccus sp. (in: a-proteobacteria)]|uniref:diaminopimelate epimerase n=1 Tax=Paracoccus sp. TaxID=267 RepID=UPI0026DEB30C|nr:diaminopimelate epimerase [Paracoccus sp. (in: a-proteobacteria)]MDO5648380.1 diaminopimelate epimerase [Paracoccus sp. (in: a-proteobacteria)]
MENTAPLSLSFMKMHGLGNDFVVLDSRHRDAVVTPDLARAMGDRHRGVGFDQLAEIRASDRATIALDFWNSDGSRAGACGNATRCVGDFILCDLGLGDMTIETQRGILQVRRDGDLVAVNMGAPILDWQGVPLAQPVDPAHLPIAGDPVAVGMGNPHCVFFVPDADAVDLPRDGAAHEHHPLFPESTNVEYASLTAPDRLRMRVWERGAGITQACGSGACAAAVAAHRRGLTGRRVAVDLDGGRLDIDWRDDGVWMTGPVAYVFNGVWL